MAELGAGEKELHIILTAQGRRVKGFSGGNRFTGVFQATQGQIEFSQMAATMMACVEGMAQEQRFFRGLEGASRFSIDGGLPDRENPE